MTRTDASPVADLLIPAAIVTALLLAFGITQPPMDGGVGNDGAHYLTMADQIRVAARPSAPEPFVYRVGTPLVAAAVHLVFGGSLPAAFLFINVAAAFAGAMLFALWLRRHVSDAVTRHVALAWYVVSPYAATRFTFYYPVLADPLAMCFVIAGLMSLDRLRAEPTVRHAALIATLTFAGCLVRELVVVIAVATQFAMPWRDLRRQVAARVLPVAAAVAALVIVRLVALPEASDYSASATVSYWLHWKTVPQMVLGVLFVFGPAAVLVVLGWRDLARRPEWVVAVAAVGALSWVGGSDTERILQFAAPVVLLLIARRVQRLRLAATAGPFVAVAVLQFLAYRVGLAIGGPLVASPRDVISGVRPLLSALGAHNSFFSFFVSRAWLIAFLAAHAVSAAAILVVSLTSERKCITVKPIDV